MKIIGLEAENFKRLVAISLKLNGKSLIIGGDNEQGKSSLIDAIWVALGGASAMKELEITKPIRKGTDKAKIVLDLGDLKVTRKWTPTEALVVENKDGAVYKSPQAMLDKLMGKVFDPFEFARMKETDRKELLLSLVDIGIDLNEWAEKKKAAYDERTLINRDIKSLQARIAAISLDITAPDDEVSVTDLTAELEKRIKHNDANEKIRGQGVDCGRRVNAAQVAKINLNKRIDELNRQLKELSGQLKIAEKELDQAIGDDKNKQIEINGLVDLSTDEIRVQIQDAEGINARVRQNKQRTLLTEELKSTQAKADALTTKLDEMDKDKEEKLSKADFPVPGLSITENGVTFNDLPFGQASREEQIRVGMAIAMKMSPEIKVIRISGGESLDTNNLALIMKMADDNGYQVLMERVGDPGKIGIIIENGKVK
jgi:predicted ATP-dependent endonuclease of OLD family